MLNILLLWLLKPAKTHPFSLIFSLSAILHCNVLLILLPSYQFSNTHDLLGRISMDSISIACVYSLDFFLCYLPDTFQLASSSLFPSCCHWQVMRFILVYMEHSALQLLDLSFSTTVINSTSNTKVFFLKCS